MYAVFRSGGKQYRASQGERLRVEKLDADEGSNVSFEEVLLVGEGADVQVGRPLLDGTAVTAKVLQQGKSRKVPVVKFRRRQNYLRQGSHRQFFTEVEILAIGAAGDAPKSEGAADRPAAKKAATKKAATKKAATKKPAATKAPKKKASD